MLRHTASFTWLLARKYICTSCVHHQQLLDTKRTERQSQHAPQPQPPADHQLCVLLCPSPLGCPRLSRTSLGSGPEFGAHSSQQAHTCTQETSTRGAGSSEVKIACTSLALHSASLWFLCDHPFACCCHAVKPALKTVPALGQQNFKWFFNSRVCS